MTINNNEEAISKEKKPRKPREQKLPPKWMDDIEITKAKCKQCDKLYMADKMFRQGFKIIFPNGKTYIGCNEYWYYCNEECANAWMNDNPDRTLKEDPKIYERPQL